MKSFERQEDFRENPLCPDSGRTPLHISRERKIRSGLSGGFTFIELIIVVAIIALLSGSGLATFLDLRDSRTVLADARLVEQRLKEAQRRALAGEKPTECGSNPLTGYQVRIEPAAVFIGALCPGGFPVEVQTNTAGSTLSTTESNIVFGVLRGGATPSTIDVCETNGGDYLYQVVVNTTGSIEAPAELSGPC